MSNSWSQEEVEATVADYIEMLILQMTGQKYNKTVHRQRLQRLLNGRSEAAIELKHQNISAVLQEMHCFWIPGYKPRGNYQGLLFDVVENHVKNNPIFDKAALTAAQTPAAVPSVRNFSKLMVDPPRLKQSTGEKRAKYSAGNPRAVTKLDYVEREARNSSLGLAGEKFIVAYEQWRLSSLGSEKLAGKVEHVAATRGDELGFDVLSYDISGRERFIEVKTTSFAKETPFFITRREVGFSKAETERFYLYRLFDFRNDPRFFKFQGPVDDHCKLDPLIFQARFS